MSKQDHNHDPIPTTRELTTRKKAGFMAEKLPGIELSSQQQFLNMLPAFLQEAVAKLPPSYFDMSEHELSHMLFEGNEPPETHQLLRQAFWDEFDRCTRHKIAMLDIFRIIQGVCSIGYFTNRFISIPENLAWLITAPTDYLKSMKEILQMGITQFRSIVSLPNTNPDGTPNTKLMEVKVKIIQHVDMRVKGAVIQRVDQRNINVNVDGDSPDGQKALADARSVDELSMPEVDARLKALEHKSQALSAPAQLVVDMMKPPPERLDADEETQGIKKPDVARYGVLPE